MSNMPEVRRGKLKKMLCNKQYVRVMEAASGLEGIIVENTKVSNKEYDAIWISSLCHSALKGKADNEVVDFSRRIDTVDEILEVTSKPIIFDGDTGGRTEHFISHIRTLERMGVSAIIIEDKTGTKHNSILGNKVEQCLEDKKIFAEKIRRGKQAQLTDDFMIFARIESFIADKDITDALDRAELYIKAGADGIMIHSYKSEGTEVICFLQAFKQKYPNVITIVVPTTYDTFKESELNDYGADIIIYANHLLRSAYQAMLKTAQRILETERSYEANNEYCISMKEILELIGDSND